MLRTIVWMTWFFGYFICFLPAYWKARRLGKQGKVEEQKKYVAVKVEKWAKTLLKNLGVKVHVTGRENLPAVGETVVFVGNHQSYFDIPVVLGNLDFPHALLAKNGLSKIPFLSDWMNLLGCIYVEREDARASMLALRAAEDLLKNGDSIIVFPEGTRSRSDAMGEFKAGAMRMALKSGVKIVPFAIDGSYKGLEGNGKFRLTRCDVRLVILPAVETEGLSRQEQKDLPQKLEELVREAKDNRG